MVTFNQYELEKSLEGVSYPADKEAIIQGASKSSLAQEGIDVLVTIPEGVYASAGQILEAIGSTEDDEEQGD